MDLLDIRHPINPMRSECKYNRAAPNQNLTTITY